jgi:hypothetical protein
MADTLILSARLRALPHIRFSTQRAPSEVAARYDGIAWGVRSPADLEREIALRKPRRMLPNRA